MRENRNRPVGNGTATVLAGSLNTSIISDLAKQNCHLRIDNTPRVPTLRELSQTGQRAALSYYQTAYEWAVLHYDEVSDVQDPSFPEIEDMACEMMAHPAVFLECIPDPLTLNEQWQEVLTGYVAAGIRAGTQTLSDTSRELHRQFHATVQAHLKDPRSYAEIEQARRSA